MSDRLEQITVRIEPELSERLQRAADNDQRSLAYTIRRLLRDAVAKPATDQQQSAA